MGFADLVAAGDRVVRNVLGDAITYSPSVGAAVAVQGVFDSQYVKVDLGQPGVSSVSPAAFLRREDLPSDVETDTAATVTFAGVVYTVHEVQPDGMGGVILLLHRA